MLVYRLEHKADSLGPFASIHGQWTDENGMSVCIDCIKTHKAPSQFDTKIGIDYLYKFPDAIFAWDTQQKLLDFIVEDTFDFILSKGFDIVCYNVQDYVELPDGQIIFCRENAIKIENND